jgi:hypothetical protein
MLVSQFKCTTAYQERIEDAATELKIIMLQQRTVTNRQKVQALYLLKSGLSQSITDVAKILGGKDSGQRVLTSVTF